MEHSVLDNKIAIVILNYNSEQDLMASAPQLAAQTGVNITLILVDNASRPESVAIIRAWLADWRPDAVIGTQAEVDAWVRSNPEEACVSGRVYFIMNHENRGYSAGNNIGIKVAEALAVDAVLIVNPDVRIEDKKYLKHLYDCLASDLKACIAASAVIDSNGRNLNPYFETSYMQELFWPISKLISVLQKKFRVQKLPTSPPKDRLLKVSGCCFMARMESLQKLGYLDENVFLYCEESILSAKVKALGGSIIYTPEITAFHANSYSSHEATAKASLLFIKSRMYYLETYSEYSAARLALLRFSYFLLKLYFKAKLLCLK